MRFFKRKGNPKDNGEAEPETVVIDEPSEVDDTVAVARKLAAKARGLAADTETKIQRMQSHE